jgi:hypothetical protein
VHSGVLARPVRIGVAGEDLDHGGVPFVEPMADDGRIPRGGLELRLRVLGALQHGVRRRLIRGRPGCFRRVAPGTAAAETYRRDQTASDRLVVLGRDAELAVIPPQTAQEVRQIGIVQVADDVPQRPEETVELLLHVLREERSHFRAVGEQMGVEVPDHVVGSSARPLEALLHEFHMVAHPARLPAGTGTGSARGRLRDRIPSRPRRMPGVSRTGRGFSWTVRRAVVWMLRIITRVVTSTKDQGWRRSVSSRTHRAAPEAELLRHCATESTMM